MFNSDMMSKIGEITTRFKCIQEDMKELNLIENVPKTSTKSPQRPQSSSVQDEATVYGRDGDKAKILDLLFRYETNDAKVGVIPIVGMGGMGKTTLAKFVYNDDSIPDHHFQVKAWVCVSDVFDIMSVTKGILESITRQSPNLNKLGDVQLELERQLAGKKFLLVLDDVWTDNYDDWHALRAPLMVGVPGSKIIVTTRSEVVAKMMGTVEYHELKKISDDDCWLLFKKHAFENRSIVAQSELEKIGREIVSKRCGGLPLAARSLGGLLRSKESRNEWEEVLNNKLWSVSDGNRKILPVLELSYYYLPSHLKRCFAYCAILPKDYEFKREEIILLWMAEGLILQADVKREMEDLGSDYFHDLLSRSFFQASSADVSRFIMHDLVNDLAQNVAEDECLRLEDEVNVGEDFKWERVRHSSYFQGLDGPKRFAPFRDMKCLRTFLPLWVNRKGYYDTCFLASCVPHDLLQNLKFLRVLSFRQYNIEELPDAIGDLKHLRYLDLSYNEIEALPESITLLCNLQALVLKECRKLRKLPVRMDKLINLRHLDITRADSIEGIPLKIKELNGLQTLSKIVIREGFFSLSNLVSLKSLRGEVCISNLNNVVDASDAEKAKLKDKGRIRGLELRGNINTGVEEDGGVQYDVLHGLEPHRNIEKLIIGEYEGTRFPSWIGDPVFNKIVELKLEGSKKCQSLPQLRMLPNLKVLIIKQMPSLQRVDQEFYGFNCPNPFPCLKVLCFEEMHNWEEWNAFEFKFQVLGELSISNCRKLSGKLPVHLPSLEKLIIKGCENLVATLPSLPMLSVLEIEECKEVDFKSKVDFTSLTRVLLVDISSITNLTKEQFVQRLKKLKKLTVLSYSHALILYPQVVFDLECTVVKCPQLMLMVVDEDKEQLELVGSEFESLTLEGCGALEKLPAWIQKLMFLRYLTILNLRSLVTLPEGTVYNSQCLEKLEIEGCDSLMCLGRRQLPPTLKTLRITRCKNLKSLFHEGETYSSSSINLENLQIIDCPRLTSFSSGSELPATLKSLLIRRCSTLTCALPGGKLPSSLQSLCIFACHKVKSIAERFDYNLSLETLEISDCQNLISLPDGLHNLQTLSIENLEKLEALPDITHSLSSLHRLHISDCRNLMSFLSQGLPSNLTTLHIMGPEISEAVLEWGLERLNSLRYLFIEGCRAKGFPSDETRMMLPPSLTHLKIQNFWNLEYLSTRGFRNLTSLESLTIAECRKLSSFPENGLPDSMLDLYVYDCPILKQRCEKGKRPEWSKLRNIPRVKIRIRPHLQLRVVVR